MKLHTNIIWHHATTRVMALLEIWLATIIYEKFDIGGGLPLDTVVIGKKGVLERYVNKEHLNALEKAIKSENLAPLLQSFKKYEDSIMYIFDKDPFENRREYIEISKKLWTHEITAFFIGNFTEDKKTIKLMQDLRGTGSAQHISITDYLPRLYQQISNKLDIEKDLLKYTLPEEIINLNFNIDKLRSRRDLYVLEAIEGNMKLLVEKNAQGYIDIFTGRPESEKFLKKNIKHFTGNTAYSGKAIGKVVIVLDDTEIQNVKKGDILVSPMTRTSFVPAMKKAGAIITDEGGISCHAAIMARELKTPTVVATKIASKILKSGDIIEILARKNKGTIKIIKKNG